MSEIILHTKKFEEMRAWYRRLFGNVEPATDVDAEKKLGFLPEVDRICFLRLHFQYPYTQVLGLFEIKDLVKPAKPSLLRARLGVGQRILSLLAGPKPGPAK